MASRVRWFFYLVSLIALVGCSAQPDQNIEKKGLKIVTSFYPMYALVSEVSGDINDVRMINSAAGIHDFEPSVSDVRAIYDADVFIYHSHILESWAGRLDPNLKGSSVRVLEVSKTLPLERVEGLEKFVVKEGMDDSSLYDPHTWLDPVLVGQEALAIAEQLSQIDPSNRLVYEENAQALKDKADVLAETFQQRFESSRQKTFVTQHTAFSYTARRFGLKQLGITGVSAQEPSPRQLAEIKEFITTYGVKTIFVEQGVSDKLAKSLATSTAVQFKELNTLEADPKNDLTFLENLEANLTILADVLATEEE
ncbi:metal ABC transporter solute-binding protein, Zn/Mn family [Streptococcus entericus]|uniref:metal ABC transporter solute-binding protein, Zn/Mn family n=1 Tax=Streptococcus entericus TaxID=155680 RepID=UPI00035F38DB|nr:zinc ABC transporter substrate-binding protein [Streptococcus entericus]